MSQITKEIVTLCFESLKLKKELIEMYSKNDDQVSRIIVNDARQAIKENQEQILIFSKL